MNSISAIAFNKGPSLANIPQIGPVVGVLHFNPAVGHRIPIRVKHGGVLLSDRKLAETLNHK